MNEHSKQLIFFFYRRDKYVFFSQCSWHYRLLQAHERSERKVLCRAERASKRRRRKRKIDERKESDYTKWEKTGCEVFAQKRAEFSSPTYFPHSRRLPPCSLVGCDEYRLQQSQQCKKESWRESTILNIGLWWSLSVNYYIRPPSKYPLNILPSLLISLRKLSRAEQRKFHCKLFREKIVHKRCIYCEHCETAAVTATTEICWKRNLNFDVLQIFTFILLPRRRLLLTIEQPIFKTIFFSASLSFKDNRLHPQPSQVLRTMRIWKFFGRWRSLKRFNFRS